MNRAYRPVVFSIDETREYIVGKLRKAAELNAGQKVDFKGDMGQRNSGLSGLEL